MMSCGHIAEMNTSAIYIVGAEEPGYARGMGLKTRETFEEALEDAQEEIRWPEPEHPGTASDLQESSCSSVHEESRRGLHGCIRTSQRWLRLLLMCHNW